VLYEPGRNFEFIVMEIALLLRTCPDEVMTGQLDRLMSVTGLTNVRLGIIPLDARLSLTPLVAGFMALDDITYVETYTSEDLLRGKESATYDQVADELLAESVSGDAARSLIASASQRARAFLPPSGD
jgi:hypothetical protein